MDAPPPLVESIDIFDVRECVYNPESFPDHRIKVMIGNGCHLSAVDQNYDISFSNSVIEHVGTWEDQKKFADELRRVGKKIWCQTPAWECPVEPHYMAPFIHWLPKTVQKMIIRPLTPWGWLSKPPQEHVDFMVNTTRLVSYCEMKCLFPDCTITVERIFGIFPKSYIAVRK